MLVVGWIMESRVFGIFLRWHSSNMFLSHCLGHLAKTLKNRVCVLVCVFVSMLRMWYIFGSLEKKGGKNVM